MWCQIQTECCLVSSRLTTTTQDCNESQPYAPRYCPFHMTSFSFAISKTFWFRITETTSSNLFVNLSLQNSISEFSLNFAFLFQPANVTSMHEDVASIWNCTNYPVEFLAAYAWNVDILPQEDTATTAERVIIEIRPNK